MAELNQIVNIGNYQSQEAKKFVVEQQLSSIEDFVHDLKQKKATVYTVIMKESISGFDGVVTLSSLLLQMNLYCRKKNSLMLLKQLKADELTQAILSFYDGTYVKMREYAKFVKEVFAVLS